MKMVQPFHTFSFFFIMAENRFPDNLVERVELLWEREGEMVFNICCDCRMV